MREKLRSDGPEFAGVENTCIASIDRSEASFETILQNKMGFLYSSSLKIHAKFQKFFFS